MKKQINTSSRRAEPRPLPLGRALKSCNSGSHQAVSASSCSNKAFTLIELLVVVLIIGILAAVAVPQYQKAVLKSKLVQLRTLSSSLARAAEVYYLANGDWPDKFDQLDVDIPQPLTIKNPYSSDTCASFDDFYCCIAKPAVLLRYGAITCGRNDYSIAWQSMFADDQGNTRSMSRCHETPNLGICANVSNCVINGNNYLVTPEGIVSKQGFNCRSR